MKRCRFDLPSRDFIPMLSAEMAIEKVNVLGVGISVIDQDLAREFLFDAARRASVDIGR